MRLLSLPAAALVGVLALGACTSSPAPTTPTPSASASGQTAAPTAPASTTCQDGQPLQASLDPGGLSPARDNWPADSKLAKIKDAGKLVVGVSGDALLWGFSNPEDAGELAGFDVDVAKQVADALGVSVEYRVLPLSGRLAALQNDTVDLVAERLSMTCARWQGTTADPKNYINMSSQYYQAGQRLLIRKDLKDVESVEDLGKQVEAAERTVCAVTGSTSLANAQRFAPENNLSLVVAADSGQCLVRFQQGEVAAITADDTTLAGFAAQDTNASVVGPALTTERYALGTKAGDDNFTRVVNAALEQLRSDGTLRELYAKWMAKNVDEGVQPPRVPAPLYGRDIAGLGRS